MRISRAYKINEMVESESECFIHSTQTLYSVIAIFIHIFVINAIWVYRLKVKWFVNLFKDIG